MKGLCFGGARGESDGALADRGKEFLNVQDRRRAMKEPQSLEAGAGEERRVDLAAFGLAQARLDIATQQNDLEIWP